MHKESLKDLHLGDLVRLPSGTILPARGKVQLSVPVGLMSAFVICGELEVLLSVPLDPSRKVGVFHPFPEVPLEVDRVRSVFSGVFNYWAPHLPAATKGMAELKWRVAEQPGSLDPIVVVWRASEPIVFVQHQEIENDQFQVKHLPRDQRNNAPVARVTSTVVDPSLIPSGTPSRKETAANTRP